MLFSVSGPSVPLIVLRPAWTVGGKTPVMPESVNRGE